MPMKSGWMNFALMEDSDDRWFAMVCRYANEYCYNEGEICALENFWRWRLLLISNTAAPPSLLPGVVVRPVKFPRLAKSSALSHIAPVSLASLSMPPSSAASPAHPQGILPYESPGEIVSRFPLALLCVVMPSESVERILNRRVDWAICQNCTLEK